MYNITFTLKNDRVDKTWKSWYVSGLSASNAKRKDGFGGGSGATGPETLGQGAVDCREEGW